MKKLTTLLIALPMVAFLGCQSPDSNSDEINADEPIAEPTSLPSRQIIVEGVREWQACYKQLVIDRVFGNSGHVDSLIFPVTSLNELHEFNRSSENINFWIYLDDNNIPKFALANEGDSSQFLISEGGTNSFVTYDSLKTRIDNWTNLVNSTNDGMVYVKLYRYNWSSLMSLIDLERNNSLCIENVAHTVQGDSDIYEVRKKRIEGVDVEGYIALDLILWGDHSNEINAASPWEVSKMYDFAMPCPKNCPK